MGRDRSSYGRTAVVLLTHDCDHRLAPVLQHLSALDLPVVAVDNASVDGTAATLHAHPGIDAIALERNIGAAARNVGLRAARERHGADYVAFCDDDGWWEASDLREAAALLDAHPRVAVVNARILVGAEQRLDPISAEMRDSPLPSPPGLPGQPLASFMAGAVVVRAAAYEEVGGYDPRFFMGGEEETLAVDLLRRGWAMRYVDSVRMQHRPSRVNAPRLRAYGMRNTLWNAWLHRRARTALRWTVLTLADRPKNRDWLKGLAAALRGLPWVVRERRPLPADLDHWLTLADRRRFRAVTRLARR